MRMNRRGSDCGTDGGFNGDNNGDNGDNNYGISNKDNCGGNSDSISYLNNNDDGGKKNNNIDNNKNNKSSNNNNTDNNNGNDNDKNANDSHSNDDHNDNDNYNDNDEHDDYRLAERGADSRDYLKEMLVSHSIWRESRFWEQCLWQCTVEQVSVHIFVYVCIYLFANVCNCFVCT